MTYMYESRFGVISSYIIHKEQKKKRIKSLTQKSDFIIVCMANVLVVVMCNQKLITISVSNIWLQSKTDGRQYLVLNVYDAQRCHA